MKSPTLVLCDSCSELVEIDQEAEATIQYFQRHVGAKVVVHCQECFNLFDR